MEYEKDGEMERVLKKTALIGQLEDYRSTITRENFEEVC